MQVPGEDNRIIFFVFFHYDCDPDSIFPWGVVVLNSFKRFPFFGVGLKGVCYTDFCSCKQDGMLLPLLFTWTIIKNIVEKCVMWL